MSEAGSVRSDNDVSLATAKRVMTNTLATYLSSMLGMGLGIFSSRWVFQALGPADYGLMSVVGALIIFVTFLNGVMSGSSARYFSFSIGMGDPNETNRWFNTSLFLHLAIPAVLLLIGWPFGEWALREFLNIPAGRLTTAVWVFRLSLVSAFWSMSSAPFMGMFYAKQNIVEVSFWRIFGSIANFCLAYSITLFGEDKWFLYCAGTVAFTVILLSLQIIRAQFLFVECRINLALWRDRSRLVELLSFSWWGLFGALGQLLSVQGMAVLLNRHFNPVQYPHVNAAFAIGNTLSNYAQTFSNALMNAFTPEIVSTEGRGERARMLDQASRASKFGTYLTLLFAIPLLLEMDYVLQLWLREPPALAGPMVSLILTAFIIDRFTIGQMIAIGARGRVAGYHLIIGSFSIMTLPIAWFFLYRDFDATSVCWAYVITTVLRLLGKVFLGRKLVDSLLRVWLREVLIPCALVLLISLVVGETVIRVWGGPSFIRLCAVVFSTMISSLCLGWWIVLNSQEKAFLVHILIRAK